MLVYDCLVENHYKIGISIFEHNYRELSRGEGVQEDIISVCVSKLCKHIKYIEK
ncbi:hypothetical protein CDFC105_52685 [Clostridioides difficile]|nr:hypothetical protein CDFC105_52685 [Clostridioides difficile]